MNALKQLRKNKGLTQAEIANIIDMSQSVYARYESGKIDPPIETLKALADYFGVSVDEILGRDTAAPKRKTAAAPVPDFLSKETALIPIIGRVRAGYDALAEQYIEGYMELEASIKTRWSDAAILKVWGDSMEPELQAGDYVIITQTAEVRSGDLAVICINGDEGTIKRVHFDKDGLDLIPTNPSYGTLHFTAEQVQSLPVLIRARAVRVIRDL